MRVLVKLLTLVLASSFVACARSPATGSTADAVTAPPFRPATADARQVPASAAEDAIDSSLPPVMTYRSPTCACCELWVEHMRAAGFRVEVQNLTDMGAIKAEAGVPVGKGSCHTARVGDYYVEGHVPAGDIKRLLEGRSDARGLVVPGMVLGSPGMEQGGVKQPYDVLLIARDGSTTVFAHHGE